MAGDGWVVDVVWHTMLLVGKEVADLWCRRAMEILLGLSFAAQLVLSLFARCRWRGVSGPWRFGIWLSYVGADYLAASALGRLSLCGDSVDRELVAFWAPFFLLHLGGPDSITAYEIEDNKLSKRSVLGLVLKVLGALYVAYKSTYGRWTLAVAVWLMFLVGLAKYAERVLALRRANLVNLRRSLGRQERRQRRRANGRRHSTSRGHDDGDKDLVMKAHSLFHICKHAMVDSSVGLVEPETDDDRIKHTLFELNWEELREVMEVMEIEMSLMYDFLYTKAAVIHTWHGYCIRALSPLFIAAAFVLVELSNKHDAGHRPSDVVITRALLVATLLQETVCW
ncbi:hypothetical protein ACP70R_021707 [Stipagrostis hirtigluma subsp. patula]